MGWYVNIKSQKEIKECEIQEIMDNLPESMYFLGFIKPRKQDWGWSSANSVTLINDNCVRIGAYSVSEDIMSDYIKEKLEENGHIISVETDY